MAPEQQKDRAIGFLAVLGIGLLVLIVAGGSLAVAAIYSRDNISEPVVSPEVSQYSGRTAMTPEVAEEMEQIKRDGEAFVAERERQRLENEARDSRGTDSSSTGSD